MLEAVLESVQEDVDEDDELRGKSSVSVYLEEMVGWDSTYPHQFYVGSTERLDFNRHAHGLRVVTASTHLLAPRTNVVTIVYEHKFDPDDGWLIFIGSIYPGQDVGELDGDVSTRMEVVFFDWNHPGE